MNYKCDVFCYSTSPSQLESIMFDAEDTTESPCKFSKKIFLRHYAMLLNVVVLGGIRFPRDNLLPQFCFSRLCLKYDTHHSVEGLLISLFANHVRLKNCIELKQFQSYFLLFGGII
jgi:hypothetical protein